MFSLPPDPPTVTCATECNLPTTLVVETETPGDVVVARPHRHTPPFPSIPAPER